MKDAAESLPAPVPEFARRVAGTDTDKPRAGPDRVGAAAGSCGSFVEGEDAGAGSPSQSHRSAEGFADEAFVCATSRRVPTTWSGAGSESRVAKGRNTSKPVKRVWSPRWQRTRRLTSRPASSADATDASEPASGLASVTANDASVGAKSGGDTVAPVEGAIFDFRGPASVAHEAIGLSNSSRSGRRNVRASVVLARVRTNSDDAFTDARKEACGSIASRRNCAADN